MGVSLLLMIRLANFSRAAFTAYALAYAGIFIVLRTHGEFAGLL